MRKNYVYDIVGDGEKTLVKGTINGVVSSILGTVIDLGDGERKRVSPVRFKAPDPRSHRV